jgi:hypothetical protein
MEAAMMARRILLGALAVLLLGTLVAARQAVAQQIVPDQTGRIVSGAVPSDGGFGLVVYGGGSYAQLVAAAGCAEGRVVFWVTRDGAFLVYVPGTAVAAVNSGFQAAFPNDAIPANTPLIGRCLPAPLTGIAGTVRIGPVCPVQSEFAPCPDAPYVATLVILDPGAREVARVTSAADGRYEVAVPPGSYTILPLSPPGQQLPRGTSVDVTVVAGRTTVTDIYYDSGIRTAQ